MPQQNCEAVFENGVLRPLGNLQLNEGQTSCKALNNGCNAECN
ncbi:MAG: antitoxin family protein, partial [Microcystis panniformis]